MTDTYLEGVDLSRFQLPDQTLWPLMQDAGVQFAFIQADGSYPAHMKACQFTEIIPIAYRFLMLTNPLVPQIESLEQAVSDSKVTPTVALDCEHNPSSVSIAQRLDFYAQAVQQCIDRFGTKPVLYTYPFYDNGQWPEDFAALPLWISHPVTHDPIVPAPWKAGSGWTFWQYTDDSNIIQRVPGYPGHALRDRFRGTREDLIALLG
jgi:GH25 family lysozyme M1 (1,4-beta-N-acetylmuramidase)